MAVFYQYQQTLFLDAKGRLSLPESVRHKLGLNEGHQFILTVSETGALNP
jgi:bifunctional DNA-binding transcriptional regulator/antitoxin component of YhaV-PrlF toxin-antitoxin module